MEYTSEDMIDVKIWYLIVNRVEKRGSESISILHYYLLIKTGILNLGVHRKLLGKQEDVIRNILKSK